MSIPFDDTIPRGLMIKRIYNSFASFVKVIFSNVYLSIYRVNVKGELNECLKLQTLAILLCLSVYEAITA